MQNVPNIVRDRLRAQGVDVLHPDAEMLTAFTERSLPEAERNVVLEHVSRCGDCREVITLALPETETAVLAPALVGGWRFTWPALRWAVVAAVVAAIVSFGVLQYQRKPVSATLVAKSVPQEIGVPEAITEPKAETRGDQTDRDRISSATESSAAPASGSFSARNAASNSAPTVRLDGQPSQASPAGSVRTRRAQLGAVGGAFLGTPVQGGPKAPMLQNQQNQNQVNQVAAGNIAPVPEAKQQPKYDAAKIPPVSEMVEVQAAQSAVVSSQPASPQLDSSQINSDGQNQSAQLQVQSAEQPAAAGADETRIAKAKPATSAEDAVGASTTASTAPQDLPLQIGVPINGRNLSQMIDLQPEAAPRWMIASNGALQRSIDQGSTWQNIDVNAANTLAYSQASTEIASTTRAKKSRDLKKTADQQAAAPLFRAITVSGTDVWAGGSGGVLYHSSDAGIRWTRVVLVTGGSALIADVVGIEFADTQHGRITTSTAEIWTTADAGQSWQKQ